jgi:hypothetical protein
MNRRWGQVSNISTRLAKSFSSHAPSDSQLTCCSSPYVRIRCRVAAIDLNFDASSSELQDDATSGGNGHAASTGAAGAGADPSGADFDESGPGGSYTYSVSQVLPTPFRPLFSFEHFNRMQTACFEGAFLQSTNMVVAAPTGRISHELTA